MCALVTVVHTCALPILVDQPLKNPSALAPAANAVGLPLQKLGPFSRENGTGIAASPAVVREAFSEELIQDGTVSNPIEIAPGHSVVIRVTGHTAIGRAHV